MFVQLDRRGQAVSSRVNDKNQGRPRDKKRTIDLRPGDEVYRFESWRKISSIRAVKDAWLTPEQARQLKGERGYLYWHRS